MSNTVYLTGKEPLIRDIAARTFPDYTGRQFKLSVVPEGGTINCASYWDGGSRDYFVFIRLDTLQATPAVPPQSAFDRPVRGLDRVILPEGVACVEHSIFCGKDMGLTIHVPAANAAPLLPAAPNVSEDVTRVLICTRGLKSSYGGDNQVRFHAAERNWRMTREMWDAAVEAAKAAGYLNKAGAITTSGRNVIADNHTSAN
jgi:hypothetical protein